MNRPRVIAAVAPVLAAAIVVLLLHQTVIGFNMPSRARFPVRGIDVSHHQGRIDWTAVADEGIQFAWIKATEGADVRDPRFAENWVAARAAGVLPGAYHFFTFCSTPEEQATNFIAALPGGRALPPVVDVELGGNCNRRPADLRGDIARFSDLVNTAVGHPPIVYTTLEVRDAWPIDGPFWMRDVFFEPPAPWVFWQYGYERHLAGVNGLVDMDVFEGSAEALHGMAIEMPAGDP